MEIAAVGGKCEMRLYELGDAVEFDLDAAAKLHPTGRTPDYIRFELAPGTGYSVGSATWPASNVVTAQLGGATAGGHGAQFAGFATPVTFGNFTNGVAAPTVVDRQRVTGAKRARVRVTTKGSASAETVWVAAVVGWDF